jgi:hypothetical protein
VRARGGRGDAMGRGRVMQTGNASSAFSQLAPSGKWFTNGKRSKLPPRPGFGGESSSRSGGGGGGGGSGGTSTPGSGTRVKSEDITVISGEKTSSGRTFVNQAEEEQGFKEPEYPDDNNTPRINIEKINELNSSDDEPVITGVRYRGKVNSSDSNKGGIQPVRVIRREHRQRNTEINDESIIKLEPDDDDNDAVVVDKAKSAPAQ